MFEILLTALIVEAVCLIGLCILSLFKTNEKFIKLFVYSLFFSCVFVLGSGIGALLTL